MHCETRPMLNRVFASTTKGLLAVALLSGAAYAADKAADAKAEARPAAEAAKAGAPAPQAPPEPEGMVKLFNGKDLAGWEGNPDLWRYENDTVIGQTTPEKQTKGNTFLIWRGGELKDFDLRLSFRIKGGNSGVQYRARQVDDKGNKWVVAGYQAEVEDTPGKVGFLYDEKGRGYLCNVGEVAEAKAGEKKPTVTGKLGDKADIAKAYKKSDWNDYVIIARGNVVKHYINGVQTVEFTDNDEKNRDPSGLLALQIHSGPPMTVEFKDVRLKQFDK